MRGPIRGQTSLTTVGLDMVLSVVIGWLGGRWLDRQLDTPPWLEIFGACIGVAAGFRSLHRGYLEMRALSEKEESEKGNPRPMWGQGSVDEPPESPDPPRSSEPPIPFEEPPPEGRASPESDRRERDEEPPR